MIKDASIWIKDQSLFSYEFLYLFNRHNAPCIKNYTPSHEELKGIMENDEQRDQYIIGDEVKISKIMRKLLLPGPENYNSEKYMWYHDIIDRDLYDTHVVTKNTFHYHGILNL